MVSMEVKKFFNSIWYQWGLKKISKNYLGHVILYEFVVSPDEKRYNTTAKVSFDSILDPRAKTTSTLRFLEVDLGRLY